MIIIYWYPNTLAGKISFSGVSLRKKILKDSLFYLHKIGDLTYLTEFS
jgi:hypothetical protein